MSKTCWGMELGNPVEHSVHSLRALTKDCTPLLILKNRLIPFDRRIEEYH